MKRDYGLLCYGLAFLVASSHSLLLGDDSALSPTLRWIGFACSIALVVIGVVDAFKPKTKAVPSTKTEPEA